MHSLPGGMESRYAVSMLDVISEALARGPTVAEHTGLVGGSVVYGL